MELRNLNTFITVASLQNFTKAAKELGYSQSNVSTQIKQLEEEIGLTLFDRIGKYAFLSKYGETLLPYARSILEAAGQIKNLAKLEDELGGTIKLGMTDSLVELIMEKSLTSFHEKYPKVKLELSLDPVALITEQLQHGLLDIACVIYDTLPPSEWIIWDSINVPIVAVTHPGNELAHKASVSPAELENQHLILMEASAPYSKQFASYMEHNNLNCKPFLRLQSADLACRLVENGPDFVSILPQYTVQKALGCGKLKMINLQKWSYQQAVQLVLHKNKIMTPQIEGFLNEMKKALITLLD